MAKRDFEKRQYVCPKCGYTELYKSDTSLGMNILDLLM